MRTEIRIGGFGGQGVIMTGIVIGKAASLYDGNHAVQTQSYGPEARGGASKSEVVISDEPIEFPEVQAPDIFIAMSHTALMKYKDDSKEGGILIIDPDLVNEEEITGFVDEKKIKLFRAPATRTATEVIGLRLVANIVILGAIVKAADIVSVESAKKAILESVPKGTEEKNIQAFEEGYNLIE